MRHKTDYGQEVDDRYEEEYLFDLSLYSVRVDFNGLDEKTKNELIGILRGYVGDICYELHDLIKYHFDIGEVKYRDCWENMEDLIDDEKVISYGDDRHHTRVEREIDGFNDTCRGLQEGLKNWFEIIGHQDRLEFNDE